jgi:hypothetical protein
VPLIELQPSRRRRLFVACCLLPGLSGVVLLVLGPLPLLAVPASLCWLLGLLRALPDPADGVVLGWRDGQWLLWRGDVLSRGRLRRGAVCLPWVTHAAFDLEPAGGRLDLLLFADHTSAADLRQLRRRLRLSGTGSGEY